MYIYPKIWMNIYLTDFARRTIIIDKKRKTQMSDHGRMLHLRFLCYMYTEAIWKK